MNEGDPLLAPETAKFLKWYAEEKKRGLVDVKFFPGNKSEASVEEFFSDVNSAIESPEVPDNRDL